MPWEIRVLLFIGITVLVSYFTGFLLGRWWEYNVQADRADRRHRRTNAR